MAEERRREALVSGAQRENDLFAEIAKMALGTLLLNPSPPRFPRYLLAKHYQRKHGPGAYYGQKKGEKT